jgi:hypothetical protein
VRAAIKKLVDDWLMTLHNLASLLLMQQRKTAVPKVGVVAAPRRLSERSLTIHSR